LIKKISQYYQIFCNLSLDVILGVCCCMISIPICFQIAMPLLWYISLPLSTWAIYLADHLIDVFRNQNEYPTPRHQFIKKHFKQIAFLIILICLVDMFFLIKYFNTLIVLSGIPLVFLVLLHFILVRVNPQVKSMINNKEFAVATIYAIGIYVSPLFILYLKGNIFIPIICFLIFYTLTFMNLLMVSIIEYDYDKQMKNSSWVINISVSKSTNIFYVLVAIVISLGCSMFAFVDENVKLLLIIYQLMAIGHFFIFRKRMNLMSYLAYRKLAEILFWLPGIIYIITIFR